MSVPVDGAIPLVTLTNQLGQLWAFNYARQGFIATDVFRVAVPAKSAGQFTLRSLEEMLKFPDNLERAPTTEYAEDVGRFDTATYETTDRGITVYVDDNDRANYAELSPDPDMFATLRGLNIIQTSLEKRVAAQVFDTTTYTVGNNNAVTPTAAWTDRVTARPRNDVEDARKLHFDNSGMDPNAIVMNRQAFNYCRLTDDVTAAIASSGAGDQVRATDVTRQQLAEVFDVDMVLVAGAAEGTGNVAPAARAARIWGPQVAVCTVAMTDDFQEACLGRVWDWRDDGGTTIGGGTVEGWRHEPRRSDAIRVRNQTGQKRLVPEMNVLIEAVYTP